MKQDSFKFKYTQAAHDKCLTIDSFHFLLPKETLELKAYSQSFGSELLAYNKMIADNELEVYIIKHKDKIICAIEHLSDNVISILGAPLSNREQNIINKWMNIFHLRTVHYNPPLEIEYEPI